MTNRKLFVAGNWKMNGSPELVSQVAEAVCDVDPQQVDVVIIPPDMLLKEVVAKGLAAGVQTVSQFDAGAYTGETQAKLVKALGGRYTLVGHSERRSIFSESDEQVADKFAKAQQEGLIPILCVGETLEQREQKLTELVVLQQIDAVINKMGVDALGSCVIAYEPVWAIGTGKTASGEQAQQVHHFIREQINQLSPTIAASLRIVYGGSVNENNCQELFAQADIDGGLIGGASLKPESFKLICQGNLG